MVHKRLQGLDAGGCHHKRGGQLLDPTASKAGYPGHQVIARMSKGIVEDGGRAVKDHGQVDTHLLTLIHQGQDCTLA